MKEIVDSTFGEQCEYWQVAVAVCTIISFLNLPCTYVFEPLLLHDFTDLVYFLLSEADHDYDYDQQQQAGRHHARPHQPTLRPGQLCKHCHHAALWVYCASGIMTFRFLSLFVLLKNRIIWWKEYFGCKYK